MSGGLIESTAEIAGLPLDLLRMAICLVFSYPLCSILKRLPDDNKLIKEVYVLS
jgi:lysophospholipid acyltransferase